MKFLIDKLTGNSYALPLLALAICIWRIFVPQLTVNQGLGWDGFRYYLLTAEGLQSSVLDSYLVLRIFPSLFIHVIFEIADISFSPANVILAFKILNSILIAYSAWMVKKIFEQNNLNAISQIMGFALIFLNYAVFNFTYYYPVMTDTPAFFLSVALFYFFLRGQLINIWFIGLIGAFTLPVLLVMAVALILFPQTMGEFKPVKRSITCILAIMCSMYAMLMGWYLIFMRGELTDIPFSLPISYGMLPVTFLCVGILYFFMPFVFNNRSYFTWEYYRALLKPKRIFAVVALVITVMLLLVFVDVKTSSDYLSIYHQVKIHLFYAFQRPMITVVSHFNYFGCIMLLLLIFWRKFARYVSGFGLGIVGSVFVSLFIFSMKPESRALIFFFPWLMIMMSLFLGRYKFSKIFYFLLLTSNFVCAKLWLYFEYADSPITQEGTFGFPMQWFMMHLGIWMSESVWLWLCLAVALLLLCFILTLYKIELGRKAIYFYNRYELV